MKFRSLLVSFLIFLFFAQIVFAAEQDQFVTVVNPLRISHYTKDVGLNIATQYSVVKKFNLPATWLLTYDAMRNEDAIREIAKMDRNQELGILLEVTSKLAKDADVFYHQSGSWHFARSVFLSGYTQEERRFLIDTVFTAFREIFGYYPASVGSWWTDSYSLSYMKEKYDIVANLTVADQFSTDGYQIWGQYWSVPFYPSRYHAGIPAPTKEVKLDVVMLPWAPRDPMNGYYSSLYSTQDYKVLKEPLDISYFEKLVRLYTKKGENQFGHIVVGLEGDLAPESYTGEFAKQIEVVANLSKQEEIKVVSMKDFASWYLGKIPDLSPPHKIETDDLLGRGTKVFWYVSPRYRVGVLYDDKKEKIKIFDLRIYSQDYQEPYYLSPNRDDTLSIYIPSLLDEVQNSKAVWEFDATLEDFRFLQDNFSIAKTDLDIPKNLLHSPLLRIFRSPRKIDFAIRNRRLSLKEGDVFSHLSIDTIYYLKGRKNILKLLLGLGWDKIKFEKYLIPQGEIDGLFHLSLLPWGKVLVYDIDCLQCSWHTESKPAVFANLRGYIRKYTRKPIVRNQKVFTAATREESKKEFDKTGAKYIYLSKFEDYKEKLPFSPGDLGVEKIYENANTQIWEVKN